MDQWRVVKDLLSEFYTFDEDMYYSILPTATQYARNSIFSGLMPLQIEKLFPDLWVDEESEEGKQQGARFPIRREAFRNDSVAIEEPIERYHPELRGYVVTCQDGKQDDS